MVVMPIIDTEKCQGCGLCVSVCSCGALALLDKVVTAVKLEGCQWCTLCEMVCPSGAISCPFEVVFEENGLS